MKLPRRTFLELAAGGAALSAASRFAWAPIRRGRCASSSVIPLAVVPTLSREQFGRCCSLQSPGSGCQLITITTARLTSSACLSVYSSKMSKEKQDDDQPEGYDDAGEPKLIWSS